MNQEDACTNVRSQARLGSSEVCFDLCATKYDRVHVQSFQFGVALAKHIETNRTSHKVVWKSRTPAIPSTVQMLSVPGGTYVVSRIATYQSCESLAFLQSEWR